MKVVVDTSVWFDYFRGSAHVWTRAELLAGVPVAQEESLRSSLDRLPWIDVERQDWLQVGQTEQCSCAPVEPSRSPTS